MSAAQRYAIARRLQEREDARHAQEMAATADLIVLADEMNAKEDPSIEPVPTCAHDIPAMAAEVRSAWERRATLSGDALQQLVWAARHVMDAEKGFARPGVCTGCRAEESMRSMRRAILRRGMR